uniref:Uncharacterized protein LOC123617179 n=1 Tax=Camelus bactrianus TaxID=9837 RepID=A0A9W3G6X4_CAMBA|nr:uncharacterized protein LOC123617179 [Camelus bactrianus]
MEEWPCRRHAWKGGSCGCAMSGRDSQPSERLLVLGGRQRGRVGCDVLLSLSCVGASRVRVPRRGLHCVGRTALLQLCSASRSPDSITGILPGQTAWRPTRPPQSRAFRRRSFVWTQLKPTRPTSVPSPAGAEPLRKAQRAHGPCGAARTPPAPLPRSEVTSWASSVGRSFTVSCQNMKIVSKKFQDSGSSQNLTSIKRLVCGCVIHPLEGSAAVSL